MCTSSSPQAIRIDRRTANAHRRLAAIVSCTALRQLEVTTRPTLRLFRACLPLVTVRGLVRPRRIESPTLSSCLRAFRRGSISSPTRATDPVSTIHGGSEQLVSNLLPLTVVRPIRLDPTTCTTCKMRFRQSMARHFGDTVRRQVSSLLSWRAAVQTRSLAESAEGVRWPQGVLRCVLNSWEAHRVGMQTWHWGRLLG